MHSDKISYPKKLKVWIIEPRNVVFAGDNLASRIDEAISAIRQNCLRMSHQHPLAYFEGFWQQTIVGV